MSNIENQFHLWKTSQPDFPHVEPLSELIGNNFDTSKQNINYEYDKEKNKIKPENTKEYTNEDNKHYENKNDESEDNKHYKNEDEESEDEESEDDKESETDESENYIKKSIKHLDFTDNSNLYVISVDNVPVFYTENKNGIQTKMCSIAVRLMYNIGYPNGIIIEKYNNELRIIKTNNLLFFSYDRIINRISYHKIKECV